MRKTCPKCGRPMAVGSPHGPGVGQWECRPCGVYIPIPREARPPQAATWRSGPFIEELRP